MKNKFIHFTTLLFTLLFIGCGSSKHGESTPPPNTTNFKNTSYVYQTNSPYKNILLDCIDPEDSSKSCTLNTLPFLAQESSTITKEMIMKRLVVSDAWMGERFSQLLDTYNGKDIKKLFGAITAVVIHKDIIPSFYTELTGAIYLDPRNLWLTSDEASTITQNEDYRKNFGSTLQFITGSFMSKNGNSISAYQDLNSVATRTLDELIMPFAALLYHELAHANDFVPPNTIKNIDKSQSVYQAVHALHDSRISKQLYNHYPLTSTQLISLGKVLYSNHVATEEEKELTGYSVGLLFNEDRASDIYGYSNLYEDTATLFADTMMKIHYGVNNNVVFLNADKYINENKIKLEWGIRNAIGKANVKPRALFVTNRLNPIPGGWESRFKRSVGTSAYLSIRKMNKQVSISLIQQKDIKGFKYFSPYNQK